MSILNAKNLSVGLLSLSVLLGGVDVASAGNPGKHHHKKKIGFFTRVSRAVKRKVKRVAKKVRRGVVKAGAAVTNKVMDGAVKAKSKVTGKKPKYVWVKGHYKKGNKHHTKGHWMRVKHHKGKGGATNPGQSNPGQGGMVPGGADQPPVPAPAGDPTLPPQ